MENIPFDWLDSDYALDYRTPEIPTSSSPRASQASLAAERADPPSGEHALPYHLRAWNTRLLRLLAWFQTLYLAKFRSKYAVQHLVAAP
jgi:hypothetical protein